MYNMLQDQDVTAAYKSLTVTEELYKDCSKKYVKQINWNASSRWSSSLNC